MFGKATKTRRKVRSTNEQHKKYKPGDMVVVDTLISSTPGFIAQMKGRLTNRRYHNATIYVDAATGHGYVNLIVRETAKETIQETKSL